MTALKQDNNQQRMNLAQPAAADNTPAELSETFDHAAALVDKGRLEEARRSLEVAAIKYADSPLAHFNLSVAYFLTLRRAIDAHNFWEPETDEEMFYQGAMSELAATLEIAPDFTPALNNMGTLLLLRHDKRAALEAWRRSIKIDPEQTWLKEDIAILERELE